ncbi:MAG: hypothetical protein JWO15_2244 [Sphingomonadales bacterium]|nr:hypothetical protein [Sphingomonadales bacterium]
MIDSVEPTLHSSGEPSENDDRKLPAGKDIPPLKFGILKFIPRGCLECRHDLIAFPMTRDLVLSGAGRIGNPAQVFQRVAQMSGFPIQHCRDIVTNQKRIARFEIAMNENPPSRSHGAFVQPASHDIHFRERLELNPPEFAFPFCKLKQRRNFTRIGENPIHSKL